MHTIHLTLLGEPVGKARARATVSSKGKHFQYTPTPTAHAENRWKDAFLQAGPSSFPPRTPLEISVTFYLRRPPSAPKKRTRPVTRPDWENLAKLVCDALEKLAYDNDSCIVDAHVHKKYARYPDPPRTEISITEAA